MVPVSKEKSRCRDDGTCRYSGTEYQYGYAPIITIMTMMMHMAFHTIFPPYVCN